MIVADSLRYDSVYNGKDLGVDYLENNSVQFINASSPACWTLPATASLFTGNLPHEHNATSQTRSLNPNAVSLAEILKEQGYKTYQLTSNVATTEIFGLDRGFDRVIKTWDLAEKKGLKISQLLVLLGKYRIRKKLFSRDAIKESLSSDIKAGSVWFRAYYQLIFDHARAMIAEHDARNEQAFIFINLMETHFPYHIASEFKFSSINPFKRISELRTLFNIVNQSFLTRDDALPSESKLKSVQSRQVKSWELIRNDLNEFVRSIHQDQNNLVVFTSDHGENFGDQNWVYHFSNVTDACTRVPIFWLDPEDRSSRIMDHKTSSRMLFHSIARRAGYDKFNGEDLFRNTVFNTPISQSYWYDNHGNTLPKYKFNQFCFHHDGMRYLRRNGIWSQARTTDYQQQLPEESFSHMDAGLNPIEEFVEDQELKKYLNDKLSSYLDFESKIRKG